MTFSVLGIELTPFVMTIGLLIIILSLFVLFMLTYFIVCRCCCCSLCKRRKQRKRSTDTADRKRNDRNVANQDMIMAMRTDLQNIGIQQFGSGMNGQSVGYAKALYSTGEDVETASQTAGNNCSSLYTATSASCSLYDGDENGENVIRSENMEFAGICDLPALPEGYVAYSLPHYYTLNGVSSSASAMHAENGNRNLKIHESHFKPASDQPSHAQRDEMSIMTGDSGSLFDHAVDVDPVNDKGKKKSLFKFVKKQAPDDTDSETDYFHFK